MKDRFVGWKVGVVWTLLLGGMAGFSQDSFARSASSLSKHTFEVSGVFGVPQFIGIELDYLGLGTLQPGFSFGSAPVQSLLQNVVSLPTMNVSSSPDMLNIYPSASYLLYAYSLSLKWFLSSSFFLDLLYSSITATANVTGTLKNEGTGGSYPGALNGTASLTQGNLGMAVGYNIEIYSSLFLSLALGGSYLFVPSYQITMGGAASGASAVVPGGEAAFDNAKASVTDSFNNAVGTYRSTVRFLPMFFMNLGFSF